MEKRRKITSESISPGTVIHRHRSSHSRGISVANYPLETSFRYLAPDHARIPRFTSRESTLPKKGSYNISFDGQGEG